ncbi:MAG: hypothetical protein IT430_00005 [Phycisphaerales bacterium]|nr:hypothetical protein [Phycisphaerales bacterium]
MAKSKTPTRSAASPPEQSTPSSIEITAPAQIDVEAAAGEGTTALPRFKMVAYTGSAMRVAAWRHPVILDLAGLNIPSQQRPIRFSHDPASGVGHTDTIRIEQGQLIASGLVSRDTPTAREIVTSSKNGFPWQASVGASVEEFEFIREGQKVLVNGQEFAGPVNVVRKATLGEISFVDLGADGKTSVNVAAIAATQENIMDGENKDNENGTSVSSTNGVVSEATAESAPSADVAATGDTKPSAVEDIRAQALAETSRIAAVRRLCAGQHDEIEAKAIREGWDSTRTELEILRASRPKAPAVHVPDQSVSTQILEAACLIAARFEDLEKHCEERSLDLAAKRFRGGIGLQELLLEAAWANGYTGRNFRDSRSVLRFAFNPGIEAGISTIDIGGILSNVANKFLLEGFFSVERTWRNITAVRNVSDFKTVTSYRLVGKDQYEIVAPGGELKHGTLGEEQYTNKADTYGLLLAIDRRDIINDDLGAITTVPRKLGRGSGLKINDVFWSIFMANTDFFKVGNKNFLSGADTVLSIDGLTKAEVAFMDQVDGDGKPLGMLPAILLVPTSLSAVGTQLFKSMELRDTTASTKYPVSNPHQGKFRVEVSRYLSNASYTGNSAKAWYLLADPTDLPVIEVAFLNGQESPTIETAEADFNVLGIQMRGYHDFGCALQDPRGGVRAKGEA